MKRVLIITYYWPPSGGGGVMRWLKMSKYLPEYGWKPIIYTPENPDASVIDESLSSEIHPDTEIIKTPIWEPYGIFRKFAGIKKKEKLAVGYISDASSGNWKNRLSVFIRGNFLIPDPRKFWIKPSVKFLAAYLEKNPVDLIVSTGPPHSMHLIALGLRKKRDVAWIADFRDPWTDIYFYDKLRLTRRGDRKHRKLELKVLENADFAVTVSPNWAESLNKVPGEKVKIINNGYDHVDFEELTVIPDNNFSIAHFGVLNADRNPAILWKALGKLCKEDAEFKSLLKIRLIGQVDETVIREIEENGLGVNLAQIGHLPHRQGLQELAKSQILLLPNIIAPNVKGVIPGKMYEYMALKRPILAVAQTDSDIAGIISETRSGITVDNNDFDSMKSVLENYFKLFKENGLKVQSVGVEQYSRKNLTKRFIALAEGNLP